MSPYFRDQFELFAPVLTFFTVGFAGVAFYGVVRANWTLAAGMAALAGVCFIQACIGWGQRRKRGDDKWRPM